MNGTQLATARLLSMHLTLFHESRFVCPKGLNDTRLKKERHSTADNSFTFGISYKYVKRHCFEC